MRPILFAALSILAAAHCFPPLFAGETGISAAPVAVEAAAPDYADDSGWICRPAAAKRQVDLFYLYPTLIADREKPVMDTADPRHRRRAREYSLARLKPFGEFADVYAPFYRQAEYRRVLADLKSGGEDSMRPAMRDVEAAFDEYLRRSGDRPFILIGHSQGAYLLFDLLKKRFRDPALRKRLAAAYLLGIPVSRAELARHPHLRFAEGEEDIGVIITYQTQKRGAANPYFIVPDGLGINPVNWRRDDRPGPPPLRATLNPENGALYVDLPNPERFEIPGLGRGVYHGGDQILFADELARNARLRAAGAAGERR